MKNKIKCTIGVEIGDDTNQISQCIKIDLKKMYKDQLKNVTHKT